MPSPAGPPTLTLITSVVHPAWCRRDRCEQRSPTVLHRSAPQTVRLSGDDVEMALSRYCYDTDVTPARYQAHIRRTDYPDEIVVEFTDDDIDAIVATLDELRTLRS